MNLIEVDNTNIMNHIQKQMFYFFLDGHYHIICNNDAFEKILGDDVNIYLDSKDFLSKKHVSASHVNVLIDWISRVDHQTIHELHGLGSLTSELARDHDLASLGSGLHDEAENSVTRSSDSKSSDQLVTERLNGAQTTGDDL